MHAAFHALRIDAALVKSSVNAKPRSCRFVGNEYVVSDRQLAMGPFLAHRGKSGIAELP